VVSNPTGSGTNRYFRRGNVGAEDSMMKTRYERKIRNELKPVLFISFHRKKRERRENMIERARRRKGF